MVKRTTHFVAVTMLFLLTALGLAVLSAQADTVPRITTQELATALGEPGLIVVDSRSGSDWRGSSKRIPGAFFGPAGKESTWAKDLPRDAKIVVYCA